MATNGRIISLAGESLEGTAELVIELSQTDVDRMALELTLLLAGLTEVLRVRPQRGPGAALTLIDSLRISKARVSREPDGTYAFAIGRNQAEYLQAVLLRAYRDRMAEGDHVHIEGESEERLFDLTIMFQTFREPMTPEQAKLLMDR